MSAVTKPNTAGDTKSDPLLAGGELPCPPENGSSTPAPAKAKAEKEAHWSINFRADVWAFLHVDEHLKQTGWRKYARNYEIFSLGMVIYLVLMDTVTSVPGFLPDGRRTIDLGGVISMDIDFPHLVDKIESYIYFLFTVEYTLRLWSCPEDDSYAGISNCRARLRWMRGGMEMVDFVVLTGYYAGSLTDSDNLQGLGALRMLRLLRIAALFKMERKTNSFSKILGVMSSKRNELVATLFMATVLAVMSATMMYTFEGDVNPWFNSVPAALWWSIAALTTVGYGALVS